MKINLFKKSMLVAMTLALIAAALPLTGVLAAPAQDPTPPPTSEGEKSTARLEKLWARELRGVERYGNMIDRSAATIEKIQAMIDKAAGNGKDVDALQAALDAYEEAVSAAGPMYEEARSIADKHAGFDADGKVTDREQALQTLKALRDQLKELREQIGQPNKALRAAIKAFREANPPADGSGGA